MINENEIPHRSGDNLTMGSWVTEVESVTALDAILNEYTELWQVHHEVWGKLIQPAECQKDNAVRIDRIVIPKRALINLGFKHGAFGIECKKSGEKIGPPIAQATDYTRCIYKLPIGLKIWLDMVFVWPMAPQHGPLASVLYQQRIGSAFTEHWWKLVLRLGEANVLRISKEGAVTVGPAAGPRKAGNHG